MKSKILLLLEENRDTGISGGQIATQLGVTRAAVWKAVQSLEKEGHLIQAVPGRGYRLREESDVLSREAVSLALETKVLGRNLVVLPQVDSTNTYLKTMAVQGAPEGTVVIAQEQTGGKGRLGRSFSSPPGCGLYMSVLLRPKGKAMESAQLTALAAVAGAEAAQQVSGAPVEIKWVNDLMLGGKKVCGILTEAALELETGGLEYMVVGMGFNAHPLPPDTPPEVLAVAGSLSQGETRRFTRSALAAAVLQRLEERLAQPQGQYLADYRRRSCVVGRQVTIVGEDPPAVYTAVDIDDQACLVVEDSAGSRRSLNSREISVRPV